MSEIVGEDITPDSSTNLRKMLKFNLVPCLEQLEAISGAASKVRFLRYFIVIRLF